MMNKALPERAVDSETGFGLVEIVVAMFILGIVAISLLPLLVQGLRVSAMNATLASATQLVNDQIEQARAQATCDGVTAMEGTTITAADVRGRQFDVIVDADDSCPAAYPDVMKLVVQVADHKEPATILAEATTLILVDAES